MKVLLVDDHPLILCGPAVRDPAGWVTTSPWSVSTMPTRRARRCAAAPMPTSTSCCSTCRWARSTASRCCRSSAPGLPGAAGGGGLGQSDRASDVIRAIDLGAMGFVPKRSSNTAAVRGACSMVMSGGLVRAADDAGPAERGFGVRYRRHRAVGDAARRRRWAPQARADEPTSRWPRWPSIGLTPRQSEVLALLLKGLPNKLIATRAQALGRDREGPRGRRAARAGRQHPHAGRAGRQPDDAGWPAPPRCLSRCGEAAATPAPIVPPARRSLRDIDHLRALMQQTPATLTGNGIGILLIAGIFSPLAPARQLVPWTLVCVVLWVTRLLHYLRYRRQPDADVPTLRALAAQLARAGDRPGFAVGAGGVGVLGPRHAVPRPGL